MTHNKAMVINTGWAKVFGTLFSAMVIGGVGFAWNTNADTTVLKEQVYEMRQASLPSRMDKLEQRVDSGFTNQNQLLEKLSNKLDQIDAKVSEQREDRHR